MSNKIFIIYSITNTFTTKIFIFTNQQNMFTRPIATSFFPHRKQWLKNTGSPKSRIDKAVFSNEKNLDELTFNTFDIIK